MKKIEKVTIKRSKEITENYFQFLDKHIEDVVLGKVDEFMEINQIASELFVSHKHLTDTVQKETGNHPCYFYLTTHPIFQNSSKSLLDKLLDNSEKKTKNKNYRKVHHDLYFLLSHLC